MLFKKNYISYNVYAYARSYFTYILYTYSILFLLSETFTTNYFKQCHEILLPIFFLLKNKKTWPLINRQQHEHELWKRWVISFLYCMLKKLLKMLKIGWIFGVIETAEFDFTWILLSQIFHWIRGPNGLKSRINNGSKSRDTVF